MFQVKLQKYKYGRWFILAAGLLLMCTLAWAYTWSLFIGPMIDERGATEASMATIYSLTMAASMALSLIGGKLIEKYGSAKIILIATISFALGQVMCGVCTSLVGFAIGYVVFVGFQQAAVYIAVYATAVKYFPDWKGLATAVCGTGISVGGVFLPPLCQHFIDSMGFTNMFYAMAAIITIMGIVGYIFFPDNNEAEVEEEEDYVNPYMNPDFEQKDWKGMLKDYAFWLVFFMPLFGSTTYMLLSFQMAWIAQEMFPGITAMQAAFLISAVSVAGFAAGLFGPIYDKFAKLGTAMWTFIISTIACFALIPSMHIGVVWFTIWSLVYVCFMGGWAYIHPVVVADLFGSKYYSFNYSICYLAVSAAAMISPWIGVLGKAENGDYARTFLIAGIMAAGGTICAIILFITRRNNLETYNRKQRKALKMQDAETVEETTASEPEQSV